MILVQNHNHRGKEPSDLLPMCHRNIFAYLFLIWLLVTYRALPYRSPYLITLPDFNLILLVTLPYFTLPNLLPYLISLPYFSLPYLLICYLFA